jgi:predicted ATPase
MIVEDAHWADPTSLEAFGRLVDRIATHRVLLVLTLRPEFSPPWIGQPRVTALTLNRLTGHDIEAMIDSVAGSKHLPESIRQDIIERTDGIPLFVEEMTKAVLEAGSEALYGFWAVSYIAFNGDVMCDLAAQFLVLAEKQGATTPLVPRCWRGLIASVLPRR